jgi:hypothetical protein
LKHGDATFEAVSSAAAAAATTAGTGRKECLILPHTYRHLSSLVNHVDSPLERVEDRLRRGPEGGKTPPHVLNRGAQPGPEERELSVREQCERDWHLPQ